MVPGSALTSALVLVFAVVAANIIRHAVPLAGELFGLEFREAQEVAGICRRTADLLLSKGLWDDTSEKWRVVRTGGLSKVARAMERHRGDATVQDACSYLMLTAVAGIEILQNAASYSGALEATLGALRAHRQDPIVATIAAQAMGAFCDWAEQNSGIFGRMGAVELLVQSLHDHAEHPRTLYGLWCGLSGMACHNIPANNLRLTELGLIEIGMAHLHRYRDDRDLREEVPTVLTCLVNKPRNETHLQRLLDAGYLQQVIGSMLDFSEDQKVTSKMLESMKDLSGGRPHVAAAFRDAGAIEMLGRALTKFEAQDSQKPGATWWDVHVSGARAAAALAHEDAGTREAMRRAGLHEQLWGLLEDGEEVQRWACPALRVLATDGPEARHALKGALEDRRCAWIPG